MHCTQLFAYKENHSVNFIIMLSDGWTLNARSPTLCIVLGRIQRESFCCTKNPKRNRIHHMRLSSSRLHCKILNSCWLIYSITLLSGSAQSKEVTNLTSVGMREMFHCTTSKESEWRDDIQGFYGDGVGEAGGLRSSYLLIAQGKVSTGSEALKLLTKICWLRAYIV